MLYIIESSVMAFVEISDLVEQAKESGNEVAVGGECKTVAQAMKVCRNLIGDNNEVHIIANGGAYFAASVILGVQFTWALDLY